MKITRRIDRIMYHIFPDDCNCMVCDREIPRGTKHCLCDSCRENFPYNSGHICIRCGKPMANEAVYCDDCQSYNMYFDLARSSTIYEGVAVSLVHALKFGGKRWLAKRFAELMEDTYRENNLDAEVIVPVPISRERMRERGYNQSEEIAFYLSERLGLPLINDTIVKIKDNERQTKLSGKERRENVKGVYRLADRQSVKGRKVLLIDDILTTGSTASEVARQLRIAGAYTVYVLVFASPRPKVMSEAVEDRDCLDFTVFDGKLDE